MLARLFRYGTIPYHGGFVNFATGRTSSLRVDPAVWRRIVEQNQRTQKECPIRRRTAKAS
jgi:hypothetical protein